MVCVCLACTSLSLLCICPEITPFGASFCRCRNMQAQLIKQFPSSDMLIRLFIFQFLTRSCGEANPLFFIAITAVLVRRWVICRGQKSGKDPMPLPENCLLFLISVLSKFHAKQCTVFSISGCIISCRQQACSLS